MKILFFEPLFFEKIWGGDQLKTNFNFDIPSDKTGEAWIVSAHGSSSSPILHPEEYKGRDLKSLYQEEPELFGEGNPKDFPLLVKLIDAKEDLSVQVHPGDDYAQKVEGQPYGKTECWYIVDAKPGATIVYGQRANSREEFQKAVEEGRWEDLLKKVSVKKGDFFDVSNGVVHAIGAGVLLLEIQQSSDITYRVYDYDRIGEDGKRRDLHLEKALEVIDYTQGKDNGHIEVATDKGKHHLFENQYFSVDYVCVQEEERVSLEEDYYLGTVLEGRGILTYEGEEVALEKGQSFLLTYGEKNLTLKGNLELVLSKAKD